MTLHPRALGAPLQRVLKHRRTEEQKELKPVTDVIDLGDVQVVYMELPGVDAEDVSIDLDGTKLTITAHISCTSDYPASSTTSAEPTATLSIAERRFGLYKRTLTVPAGLREHEIGASMENGVLRLEMEKEVKKESK